MLGAVLFIGVSHLLNAFYVNDIYMQISLVMLIGLAAKNAILVVSTPTGSSTSRAPRFMDAAIGAAKLRVRPIIMTAFAFILGVMPLIFASGVYATARNIMGVALVGGMLFATLLGIFVYPRSTISWDASAVSNAAANKKAGTVKAGYLIIISAFTAACTPRFSPRRARRLHLRAGILGGTRPASAPNGGRCSA